MDKADVLDIALLCNEAYVPGALQVLASLSTRAKPETRLRFNVFTENVCDESVERMRQLLVRLHPASELRQYACDERLLAGLPQWKGSRNAAVRCHYAQELNDVDWCLHVDCDVLYLGRVEEHFAQRDEAVYACAVTEQGTTTNRDERAWIARNVTVDGKPLVISAARYFNTGVLLMNLKKMRDDDVTPKLLRFFKDHPDVPSPDQDALNVAFNGLVKMLPVRFNQSQETLTDEKLKGLPVIHYVSGLPWSPKLMGVANNRFWLWHAFADKYVWQRKGLSVRRSFSRRVLWLKMICHALLTSPLGGFFAGALQKMGRIRNAVDWRRTQVGCDVTKKAVAVVMNKV